MGSLDKLKESLGLFGYEVDISKPTGGRVTGTITGGKFDSVTAAFRASEKLCNLGIMVGVVEAAKPASRMALLSDCMELNTKHPLAKVGILRIQGSDDDASAIYSILLAETSFFHTELTEHKFDSRAEAVCSMAFSASKILSIHDALPSWSSWFERLSAGEEPTGPVGNL